MVLCGGLGGSARNQNQTQTVTETVTANQCIMSIQTVKCNMVSFMHVFLPVSLQTQAFHRDHPKMKLGTLYCNASLPEIPVHTVLLVPL